MVRPISNRPMHTVQSNSIFMISHAHFLPIRALCNERTDPGLRVYISGDNADVYEDSFLKVARSELGEFQPTMILVGIRLGIDRVTPVYWEALKASLQMPQSMGIAG